MNILRRLSLYRLLALCALVLAVGVSAAAIASALATGPTPPPKPLAQAVHDALAAPPVQGVSAYVKLTNHLLEGANLASGSGQGGELTSSPLITGASGRLWVSGDGRVRLELQAEKGDTQVICDGKTVSVYDAASNTLYRYALPAHEAAGAHGERHEAPSVAKIEEAIGHLREHVDLSGATPTDVAGQPAYTVRLAPREGGSLIGGAELSFDAVHGVPLRAAIYSTTSQAPVVELAASEVSYGPVPASVFSFTPPAGATVREISSAGSHGGAGGAHDANKPRVTTSGHGPATVAIVERASSGNGAQGNGSAGKLLEGMPKVDINGASASELRTALGTVLSFERAGTRYIVAGAVPPAVVEEVARGR